MLLLVEVLIPISIASTPSRSARKASEWTPPSATVPLAAGTISCAERGGRGRGQAAGADPLQREYSTQAAVRLAQVAAVASRVAPSH